LFNQSDKADFTYLDYRYYGQALSETKKYDLAIEQYKKALDSDSSHVELWKNISDMYVSKNDYTNAISSFDKYLNSLTGDKLTSDVYYDFGKLYYSYGTSTDSVNNGKAESAAIKKNALIKADSIFGKVISLEPTNYRGYRLRALTNLSLDPDGVQGMAKQYYEQALKIVEAKTDVARYNSVIIECSRYLGYYYSKKDFIQSKVYWNKILAINPTDEMANKALTIIEKAQKGKK